MTLRNQCLIAAFVGACVSTVLQLLYLLPPGGVATWGIGGVFAGIWWVVAQVRARL